MCVTNTPSRLAQGVLGLDVHPELWWTSIPFLCVPDRHQMHTHVVFMEWSVDGSLYFMQLLIVNLPWKGECELLRRWCYLATLRLIWNPCSSEPCRERTVVLKSIHYREVGNRLHYSSLLTELWVLSTHLDCSVKSCASGKAHPNISVYVRHSDSSLLVSRWLCKGHMTDYTPSMRHVGKSLGDRTVKVLALQKRARGRDSPFSASDPLWEGDNASGSCCPLAM